MEQILALCKKYRSFILYVLLGGITTVINIGVYGLCYYIFGLDNDISNVLGWIFSVTFAYVSNKPLVFDSHSWKPKLVIREALSFYACRLATGLIDLVAMHILVEMLFLPALPVKVIVNVIVIILNYVGSKLIVFRKHSS